MFVAGKKLYNLTTTDKGTGREQINKNLPEEIKAALGPSKYEQIKQTIYQKREEIKEKQWKEKIETYKKEMEETREKLGDEQKIF